MPVSDTIAKIVPTYQYNGYSYILILDTIAKLVHIISDMIANPVY
jgi:hypothetical protein